jgi:glutamine amidotransferase
MRAVIIDYGSGNLRSAAKACERAARTLDDKARINVTADPQAVSNATHVILPGVGAFADCMAGLQGLPGMIEAVAHAVNVQGKPFLGICVGMQLMASRGLEHVVTEGFGWIPGDVRGGSARPTTS